MEPIFIHLHTHSEYSLLDGALRIDALVNAALKNKMPAVALTNHGNMFGAVSFYHRAKEKGIKPIIGAEVYLAPKSRFDKKGKQDEASNFHLILLIENEQGYKNLVQLLTKSYLEGFYYKPRIDKELLSRYSKGLIGFSSCLKGEIPYLLLKGLVKDAEEAAAQYIDILGKENFYIELQDHDLESQRELNPLLIQLAKRLNLPLVATNDVHYLKKEDAQSHDILLCIQTNKSVNDPERLRFENDQFYFKSTEEMIDLFKEVPEAIKNTIKIAARCDFEFPREKYFLPNFEVPEGVSIDQYFEKITKQEFEKRVDILREREKRGELSHSISVYRQRLDKEIKMIKEMGFSGYFLVVWDFVKNAKERNIPVGPGRGSAAGSLVAYSLGITDIDPIEYDLLFERFLNPERVSLPDIDIDFCGRKREEVIQYVTKKYGQENVAQIITFGTMAARAVIRDVGRVLDIPLAEVDKIAKMIPPFGPEATIDNALKNIPPLKEIAANNPRIAQLLDIARKLEGQVRHASIHAAGIVIAPKPLTEFLPLYKSSKGEITTQFPMQDVEAIGLLKMDLLGLRNLTIIQDAIQMIERDTGEKVEIDKIPLNDARTFEIFSSGNTDGVFQFESSGMKDLLRNFKPKEFRDLIALNALHRPGPLGSGMTDEFIKRKHHRERVQYEFPELEPILKETRGIIVYQEQVMRIAHELAGFSLAEADILRKAMGKKVSEIMKAQRERFIQGAKKRGIKLSKASKIFDQMEKFAGYGFNKSHSAAYAYLAYRTAYLKAHYPVYFFAALLTSEAERGATSQVVKYINECKEMGIKVLPPDINESDYHFTAVKGDIRFGFSAIKNVGEGAIRSILKARKKIGKFKSIFEFFREVDIRTVNKKVIESLIKSGAFDSLGGKRSQLFHTIDHMIDYAHQFRKIKVSGQSLLFQDDKYGTPSFPEEVKDMREWDEPLLLSYEKEALGFYITGHPLAQHENHLKKLVPYSIIDLEEKAASRQEVCLAGVITSLKRIKTKKDEKMATFILEDLTGQIEVVAFPDYYRSYLNLLREDSLVWLKGRLIKEGENKKIHLFQLMSLEQALSKLAKRLIIRIFIPGIEERVFLSLKEILEKNQGECPIIFELETPPFYRLIAQSIELIGVSPTEELIQKLENLLGENSVSIDY
ncbi:MAG: DNA polymerase III subunit alpha [Candidatus Aminicenantia bacterium]